MKYAGAGVTAAAIAGVAYYAKDSWLPYLEGLQKPSKPTPTGPTPTGPTPTGPIPTTLKKVAFDYSPKFQYMLMDPELAAKEGVKFTNMTEYEGEPKPEVEWSLDSQTVSHDWNYSTKLIPGKHSVTLTARDGKTSEWAGVDIEVDEYGPDYPKKKLKVPIKGIVYTTAVVQEFYQMPPTEDQMKEHLFVIKNELGCNGIRITGDIDEISYKCAEMAIDLGYECIVLSPFWINYTPEDTVSRMVYFSKDAEKLREKHDGVLLNLVEEPSTTPRGILDDSPSWKVRTGMIPQKYKDPRWHKRYQKFLEDLIDASKHFNGKRLIGFGSWEWETAEWRDLDIEIVGDSHYWYPNYGDWSNPNNSYITHMNSVRVFGKPYYITEWGSCTYKGAWERGADAWRDAMSMSAPYNEEEQVNAIERYAQMFNNANKVDAIFLFEFWTNQSFPYAPLMYEIIKPEHSNSWSRKKAFHMYKSYVKGS